MSVDGRSIVSTLLNLAKKVVDSVAIASSAPALVLMLAMAMTAMAVVPATDLDSPEKRPTLEGVFLRLDLASLSRIYGLRDDSQVLGAAILRSFFP
jgi:hypothetical protein